jgi:hypothetical protein
MTKGEYFEKCVKGYDENADNSNKTGKITESTKEVFIAEKKVMQAEKKVNQAETKTEKVEAKEQLKEAKEVKKEAEKDVKEVEKIAEKVDKVADKVEAISAKGGVRTGAGRPKVIGRMEKPKATFYVWCRVPEGYTSASFAKHLLEKCDIVATPGNGFGPSGEGYIRMALTVETKRINEAVERIRAKAG